MSDISTDFITLQAADGGGFQAYVAKPASEMPTRAIIVFQEAFGVNPHIRDITERFAREGFLAIAPELFHRTASRFEAAYTDFETSCKPHFLAVTEAGIEADATAAFTWLASQNGVDTGAISCIGFCLGGRASFIANGVLPFKSAIAFYGGGISDLLHRVPSLKAPMLFAWGGRDRHIDKTKTRAIADAMDAAGKPHTDLTFADADHGFFCDARASYHPRSAAIAWQTVLAFLK